MKRMLWCTFLAAHMVVVALPVWGEYIPDAEEGKTTPSFQRIGPSTFTFLKVTPSARAAGMGDAYSAISEGIESIYWNPAGITTIPKLGYSFGYTQWLVGSKFYSSAAAYSIGGGYVVGISMISFQPPTIKETTTLAPTGTGKNLDVGDLAVGLVLARQMTDKMSVGGTIRFIQSKLGPEKLTGISMGVGTLLHTGFRSLRIGMSLKDLGGEATVVARSSTMPTVFHVGTAMEVVGNLGDPVSVTASAEGAYYTDRWQRWNLGGEVWMRDMLALRAGWKFRYDEESWSVGAGLKTTLSGHTFIVDISYSDFGDLLEAPIRLTVSGNF